MQLLSIILPAPEEPSDHIRLCPCCSMNFSPKLATKEVSSISSFIKVVSNNGMPIPLSQYKSRLLKKKNLSFAGTQTHVGFLWAKQISPASFLFLSDATAVMDMLLTHTARPFIFLSPFLHSGVLRKLSWPELSGCMQAPIKGSQDQTDWQ